MIKLNDIYQEDCIDSMRKMKGESIFVDVFVTSPPYNIGKDYGTYNDNKTEGDYLDWLQDVAEKSLSILKESVVITW